MDSGHSLKIGGSLRGGKSKCKVTNRVTVNRAGLHHTIYYFLKYHNCFKVFLLTVLSSSGARPYKAWRGIIRCGTSITVQTRPLIVVRALRRTPLRNDPTLPSPPLLMLLKRKSPFLVSRGKLEVL